MQLRDIGTEIFMSFVDFDAEVSFLFQIMDLNDDLHELQLLQDVLRGVNREVMEQWERLQLSPSARHMTLHEAALIRRVIITLQECERELEYLRAVVPEPATCPKCGKPYLKEREKPKKDKQ